ncbi:MAG: universal stress protein [Chitinophagaceae bacterium]
MQKILVTTDFSDESKAGLRFAIQLASQHKFDLTFFHSYHILIPTSWSKVKAEVYVKEETKKIQDMLDRFVEKVYKGIDGANKPKNCVIENSVFPQVNIMEYAAKNNFDFICISTRGAGKLKRLLGTNSANLINNSQIPVIAVPYTYRRTKITSILYASDLLNLDKELIKVASISELLQSKVELLHFTAALDKFVDPKAIEMIAKKLAKLDMKVNLKAVDYVHTLVSNLNAAIKKHKPSMLIMFTEQNRTLFQKIFFSGKSAAYSFDAKVPLLVFNKS